MRQIDADALKEKTIGHGEKIAYVVSFIWDIDTSPTIDAIQVEWLKLHAREYYEDWGEEPITVENALSIWQKEQEAR